MVTNPLKFSLSVSLCLRNTLTQCVCTLKSDNNVAAEGLRNDCVVCRAQGLCMEHDSFCQHIRHQSDQFSWRSSYYPYFQIAFFFILSHLLLLPAPAAAAAAAPPPPPPPTTTTTFGFSSTGLFPRDYYRLGLVPRKSPEDEPWGLLVPDF